MKEFVVGDVLLHYDAGTHLLGIVDIFVDTFHQQIAIKFKLLGSNTSR